MNSREREVPVKQEGDPKHKKLTPSARSQWTSHKNPRIVRVSRSFGGKDRHSKVCTVRGLRDRRIRLSVPTAVQLYDLQYKLGLNQPSKVVDWLLEAAKNDVDKLPPLPGIPGAFTQLHDPPTHDLGMKQGAKIISDQRDKWVEQDNHEGFGGFLAQLSAQNLFPLGSVNQSSFPSMPYNPYFHWDHPNPNLSLPHNTGVGVGVGGAYPLPNQAEDQSQLYLPSIIPSFPSYITPSLESLQQNHNFSTALHLSSPMKSSFVLNVNSKSVHPQQNGSGRSGKEERFL